MTIIVEEETKELHDYHQVLNQELDRHGKCVKRFCDLNNIKLSFQEVGVEEGNYNGYNWSKAISILGNLVIQSTEDHMILYLPPTISAHQYEWMKQKKSVFKRRRDQIYIYSYHFEENSIRENLLNELGEDDSIEILYEELKYKCQKGSREKNDVSGIIHF